MLYNLILEGKIQETCSNKAACPTRQPDFKLYGLDSNLVDCSIDFKCIGCQFVHSIAAFENFKQLTARMVYENNHQDEQFLVCARTAKGGCGQKQRFQLIVRCKSCSTELFLIRGEDTPQLMHSDMQQVISHDVFLPKVVKSVRDISKIPLEPGSLSYLAVNYQLTLIHIKKIAMSVSGGALKQMIQIKREKEEKNGRDPNLTHLCVNLVDEEAFGEHLAVLRIWPQGHSEHITHRGGCSAAIKCLKGPMRLQFFNRLGDEEPMQEIEIQTGHLTWQNRSNWFVRRITIPQKSEDFALSLHVFKQSVPEYRMIKGQVSKQPFSQDCDYIWLKNY